MFVSHFSSFLFYLYVSASVQPKNRPAQDKSFLTIPTMLWFNRKKWFVLRHTTKHHHNHGHRWLKGPPNAPHEALRLVLMRQIDGRQPPASRFNFGSVEGGVWPSIRSFVSAMMHHRNIRVF